MYVDESVLKFMSRKEFENSLLSNEAIDTTVAFIDISRFTSITENSPADKVVHLLNNYFDIMVKEILAQDGHVDKFIGDAIMAVFRGNYHLDRAVEACLAIRAQIEKMPPEMDAVNFSPKVSIGINSGEVISGNIGSGNLKRLDYTVIGDVVNVAQRMQSAATDGQILIGEATFQRVKESFDCRKVGEINMKNKSTPETVYEVLN